MRRNTARARREHYVVVGKHDDDSDRYDWVPTPASLTPEHATEAAVAAARAIVERRGRWTRLGSGNFGEALLVVTDDGPVVVKRPVATNVHGKPWSRESQRDNLLHEAGVANELEARGVSLVPRTVFVEVEDEPLLVREYGEPVTALTTEELSQLEADLMTIERDHDFRVEDDLQLYRRADGSLFVGDVGLWHPKADWGAKAGRALALNDSSLDYLVRQLAERMIHPDYRNMPTLQRLTTMAGFVRDEDDFLGSRRKLISLVAERERLGLSVPDDIRRISQT